MNHVAIIGSSIGGCLTAAYLKKKFPELGVTVVGPEKDTRPLVGESTVEAAFAFFKELGLEEYLRREHYKKYGLTFYYKYSLDDPGDPSYSVHESLRVPNTVAAQVNRFTFDSAVRSLCENLGVNFIVAKVTDVTLGSRGGHVLELDTDSPRRLAADFLIDASGRGRVLGRKLDLTEKPSNPQRSTFWFRLANFDRSTWLRGMRIEKAWQDGFDSFYCSHHFMGRGNWVWAIPIMSPEHRNMISIGITWRPDLYPHDVRRFEDFLTNVGMEHPSLAAFCRTGEVYDTQTYRNYLYYSKQVYSVDRWFVVGDAAATVDPLYSTGILFLTLQIRQVADMIARGIAGTLSDDYVRDLDEYFRGSVAGVQSRISRHYEVMHEPYQSHLTMHWDTLEYMYFFLPLLANGYHWKPASVQRIVRRKEFVEREQLYGLRSKLLDDAARARSDFVGERMMYLYDRSLNYDFSVDRCNTSRTMSRGLLLRSWLRWTLLREAGWKGAKAHMPLIFQDIAGAVALRTFGDKALGA